MIQVERTWYLEPNENGGQAICEMISVPETAWGVSIFWYCHKCGIKYAECEIKDRPWRAVGGLCLSHSGDKWNLPGSLESVFTVGWSVPVTIARYQVERELAFLDSPNHPYNEKENEDELVCN